MRIVSCDIENFGKLSQLHIDFDQGMNIICENNGWGKSTLAAFIKAMFYGFEKRGKNDTAQNERKKYIPWQTWENSLYGGRLCFEYEGERYIIERGFGATAAGDKTEVRLADTKLISNLFGDNIGESVFKIDRESFAKSIFIYQSDLDTQVTDEINAKLGDLQDVSGDINKYQKAEEKLKDFINKNSDSRKTGEISKLNNKINQLTRDILEFGNIENSLEKSIEELRRIETDIKNWEISREKLSQKHKSLSQEKDIAVKVFEYENLIKNLVELEDEVKKYQEDYEIIQQEVKKQSKKTASASGKKSVEKSGKGQITGSLALLFFVFGLAGIFGLLNYISIPYPGAIAAAGFLMAFICLILKINGNKKYQDTNGTTADNELEMMGYSLRERINESKRKLKKAEEALSIFEEKSPEIKGLYNAGLLEARDDNSLGQVSEEISRLDNKLDKLKEERQNFKDDIKKNQDILVELKRKKVEATELEARKSDLENKLDIAKKTSDILEAARYSYMKQNQGPLADSFKKYYDRLTDENNRDVELDVNAQVLKREQGRLRESKLLSSGYQGLIGFCLRMAFIETMYREERPFIVLDDPFVNLDDEKIEKAKELLDDISSEYQVIYLTCHNNIYS